MPVEVSRVRAGHLQRCGGQPAKSASTSTMTSSRAGTASCTGPGTVGAHPRVPYSTSVSPRLLARGRVPDGAPQASSATRRRTNDIAEAPQRQPISHRTTRRDSARRAQSRRLACVALPVTTRPYPATRAPPSRQILAAARSSGAPHGPRAPATGQAARWSPSSSKPPPQRQCLGIGDHGF